MSQRPEHPVLQRRWHGLRCPELRLQRRRLVRLQLAQLDEPGERGGIARLASFSVNRARSLAQFIDGTSNTILFSEIRSFQPSMKCGSLFSSIPNPLASSFPGPNDPIPAAYAGCAKVDDAKHSRWSNGGVYHSGFTTAWPPNKATTTILPAGTVFTFPGPPSSGQLVIDIWSANENDGGPTFAAFTSRSYHPGGVNTLLADGSVRFSKDSDQRPAQGCSLGTIAGVEKSLPPPMATDRRPTLPPPPHPGRTSTPSSWNPHGSPGGPGKLRRFHE